MTPTDVSPIVEWLQLHAHWTAAVIFLISLIESLAIAGMIVPGVILLFGASIVAGGGALSLTPALLAACLGAISGDGISFLLGKHFKDNLHNTWPLNRYPKIVNSGERFFHQHGGKSILIGRFVGPLRAILPLIAGSLGMSGQRFFFFNALSALGWAPLYVVPGFLIGASLSSPIHFPAHFFPILSVALLLIAVMVFLFIQLHWHLHPQSRLYSAIESGVQKYNFSHQFWRGFSSQRYPSGEFPLGSLVLFSVCLALFCLLALIVNYTHWLDASNAMVSQVFLAIHIPLLDPLFISITLLGNAGFLTLIFVLWVALFTFRSYYAAAIHVALAGTLTALAAYGLKDLFEIARPAIVVHPPHSFAFPSGHSTGITVFCMLMASFIAQEMPYKKRISIYIAALIPIALVGISRLYLQVHWFTDVIGGFLLGFIIFGFIRFSFNRYDREAISVDSTSFIALFLLLLLTISYQYQYIDVATFNYRLK